MSDLQRLQHAFAAYIRERDPQMLEHVVSTPAATAEQRLEIYAEAYRLRLLEVLGTDFPGLHGMLGDQQFEQLGRAYIDACPSRHASIRWYGGRLADYLREQPPYNAQPALAELARFEWTQGEVFDAPEAPSVSIDALQAIAPEHWADLGVRLHPSMRVLELLWNVPVVWQALDAGQVPPPLSVAEAPMVWLMWRLEQQPHWRSLQADEAWALNQAGAGGSFGAICEGLQDWLEVAQIPLRGAGFIKQWVSDGLVVEIRV
ncbi:MAG: DNA-binding domain-containing protein [Gammaproteobacteria bacterium]|nr:DNA-binding domain-containing protein [Gammaproteobacteria bacterium]